VSKKLIIMLAVGAVLLAGVFGYFYFNQKTAVNTNDNAQTSLAPADLKAELEKACNILTSERAKQLLGEDAVRDERLDEEQASNDNLAVSQCAYQKANEKTLKLIVRSPLTDDGKQTNHSVFDEAAAVNGVESVDGLGEKAFWNKEFGQLNVIAENEWYILEYGSILPSQRSLDETKNFANLISENF